MAEVNSECTVCMLDVKSKDQVVRSCGHMMCIECDAEWRSRGKIVRKTGEKTTETGEKVRVSVFVLESSCPCCRGKEQANAYLGRSRESLIHEIQVLSATLYANNQYVPIPYTFIPKKVFENATETPTVSHQVPVQIVTDDAYIPWGEAIFNALRIAPVAAPVAPVVLTVSPPVAAPIVIPAQRETGGMCIRRRRNLGCTTGQTRLRCPRCNVKLCRSCRNQCPCINFI